MDMFAPDVSDTPIDFSGHKSRIVKLAPLPLLGDYRLVNTPEALEDMIAVLDTANAENEFVAWDTEFHGAGIEGERGLNVFKKGVVLVGISVAAYSTAWYIPVGHMQAEEPQLPLDVVREALAPRLRSARLCAHNWKIDAHMAYINGFGELPCAFDTYTAAHFLRPEIEKNQEGFFKKNLKTLSVAELGIDTLLLEEVMQRAEQSLKSSGDVRLTYIQDMVAYAGHDAMQTLMLARHFDALISGTSMAPLYYRVFMPLLPVLANLEQQGIYVDLKYLDTLLERYRQEIEKHTATIVELLGYDPSTDDLLRDLLYNQWGMPVLERTDTGLPATTASALIDVESQLTDRDRLKAMKALRKRKKLSKIVSTYNLRNYVVEEVQLGGKLYGIIHTTVNECGAATGRTSSDAPNSQNMPNNKEGDEEDQADAILIRSTIVAPEDELIVVRDLSQIEPRGGALVTSCLGDDTLAESYRQGKDIYQTMGAPVAQLPAEQIVGNLRKAAKLMVLAIFYGLSALSLAKNKVMAVFSKDKKTLLTNDEASQAMNRLYTGIPGLKKYQWNAVAWALYRGYAESIWGFRMPAENLRSKEPGYRAIRSGTSRSVRNQEIQGWACSYLEAAMIWTHQIIKKYKLEDVIKAMMTVHDEADYRVKKPYVDLLIGITDHTMTNLVPGLGVPIASDAEVGQTWGDVQDWRDPEKWKHKPPQWEGTAALLDKIRQEKSPFADMPLADVTKPFQMSWVPWEDIGIYCWHAANLDVAIGDSRLPVKNYQHPAGFLIDTRKIKRTPEQLEAGKKDYWKGILVCRDGNIPVVSFNQPIKDGYVALSGIYDERWGSFQVHTCERLQRNSELLDAFRLRERYTSPSGTWDFAALRSSAENGTLFSE